MSAKGSMSVTSRLGERLEIEHIGQRRPWALSLFRGLLGPILSRVFRPKLEGWDQLPEDRPFMIVSNHSGTGATEVLCLAWLWIERFGASRSVAGMAHPLVFYVPVAGGVMRSIGAIPSTYRHAREVFDRGIGLIIFPGGDHEAFRPIWEARRVDLAGRVGFLKLAREAGVPIIPLGIVGSHYATPILWRSRVLPWIALIPGLIGLKRLPVTVYLIAGLVAIPLLTAPTLGPWWSVALAWLWINFLPMYFLPVLPWTIRGRLGAPMEPEALFGADKDLKASYDQVQSAIQGLVDAQ